MLLQFLRGSDQRINIVANHLRHHRPAGGIMRDRLQYLRIEPGLGEDAEVFREIKIGISVAADKPHERQIRDILHRRQRQDWLWTTEEVLEFCPGAHAAPASPALDAPSGQGRVAALSTAKPCPSSL